MLNHDAAVACAAEVTKHGYLMTATEDAKIQAAAAVFKELHEWSAEHLPVGASAEISETFVRKGLKAVRAKIANKSDEECQQTYGVPILLLLSFIPTLFNIVSWLVKWWRGEE